GLRDPQRPARAALSRRGHRRRHPRLPAQGGRGGHGLPALPHRQLRQGTAHADEEARQRWAHDALAGQGDGLLSAPHRLLAVLVAVAAILVGATPAAPPESPVSFISVDELKAALDGGVRADIIDVRHWDNYVEQHIKGARSMPLRSVAARANEITRTGLVV